MKTASITAMVLIICVAAVAFGLSMSGNGVSTDEGREAVVEPQTVEVHDVVVEPQPDPTGAEFIINMIDLTDLEIGLLTADDLVRIKDLAKSGDIAIMSNNVNSLCIRDYSRVYDPYAKYSAIFEDKETGNIHCTASDCTGIDLQKEIIAWAESVDPGRCSGTPRVIPFELQPDIPGTEFAIHVIDLTDKEVELLTGEE